MIINLFLDYITKDVWRDFMANWDKAVIDSYIWI